MMNEIVRYNKDLSGEPNTIFNCRTMATIDMTTSHNVGEYKIFDFIVTEDEEIKGENDNEKDFK